jgi:hypothetical protein
LRNYVVGGISHQEKASYSALTRCFSALSLSTAGCGLGGHLLLEQPLLLGHWPDALDYVHHQGS